MQIGYCLGACIILCSLFCKVLGQSSADEILASQREDLVHLYESQYGARIRTIPGAQHPGQYAYVQGNPFIIDRNWKVGTLQTTTDTFDPILLKYDIYADALVYAPNATSILMIRIPSHLVKRFTLQDRTFIHLPPTQDPDANQPEGYLETYYHGRLQVYGKWQNRIVKGNAGPFGRFDTQVTYYVVQEGVFYAIRNKKDLLAVCVDKKVEMKAYLKQNPIAFRSMEGGQLADAIAYYESLGL